MPSRKKHFYVQSHQQSLNSSILLIPKSAKEIFLILLIVAVAASLACPNFIYHNNL